MRKLLLIVALVVLSTGCSQKSVMPNSHLNEHDFVSVGTEAPKVIDNFLSKKTLNYEMTVKTQDNEQVWRGYQQNQEWKMSTNVEGNILTLSSDGSSLTGTFGEKTLAVSSAMFGLFSPLEHLTFLDNQKADFEKLADDNEYRIALFRLPDESVSEHITKLLGSQFQLTHIIPEETNFMGVNYVLWYKRDNELQKLGIVIYDKRDVTNEQRIIYKFEEFK